MTSGTEAIERIVEHWPIDKRFAARDLYDALTAAGFKLAGPDEVVVPRKILESMEAVAWGASGTHGMAQMRALLEAVRNALQAAQPEGGSDGCT